MTNDKNGAVPKDLPGDQDVATPKVAEPFDAESVTTDNIPTVRKASDRGYWIFVMILTLIIFEQVALGYALIAPVLPALATHFETAQIGWSITAWTLSGAVAGPLFGKLADIHGRRRILLVALGITSAGAIICAVAPTYAIFLVGRVIMGAALGIANVLSALIRDVFPKKYLGTAYGVTFTGAGLISIAAPFISGGLNDAFGPYAIFMFLFAYAVLCAVLVRFFLPESTIRLKAKIDIVGLLLLAAGGAGISYGFGQAGTWGWLSPATLGCLLGGAAMVVLFFVHQRAKRDNHPLVEFSLLKSRAMIVLMIAGGFIQVLGSLTSVLAFQLIQLSPGADGAGFGRSTTEAATWVIGGSIMAFLTGLSAGVVGRKTGFRPLLVTACFVTAASATFLAFQHTEPWHVIAASILFGVTGGLIAGSWSMLIVESVPASQQGVAAGTIGTINGIGTSVWTQLLFAIMLITVVSYSDGAPIYNNASFVVGYLFVAVVAVLGALFTFLLPRDKPIEAA
ncbi:MAG: MFS transporter [Ancrocorticia sp.]